MRTVALNKTVTTTLSGSGAGTVSVGPTASGEIWPAGFTVAVRCATNAAEAIALAFCGGGAPAGFIGATSWGSTGDSNSDTPPLAVGQQVTVQWTGGDAGTAAFLTVTGTRQVP